MQKWSHMSLSLTTLQLHTDIMSMQIVNHKAAGKRFGSRVTCTTVVPVPMFTLLSLFISLAHSFINVDQGLAARLPHSAVQFLRAPTSSSRAHSQLAAYRCYRPAHGGVLVP